MEDLRKRIKFFTILILILIILGFGIYQARFLIEGPQVRIISPENGEVLSDNFVEIVGEIKNTSRITLNNRDILVDQEGIFRDKLLLASGYNIIKVDVWDRFGRKKSKMLELVLNKQDNKDSNLYQLINI